jgi:hypothetical protein
MGISWKTFEYEAQRRIFGPKREEFKWGNRSNESNILG